MTTDIERKKRYLKRYKKNKICIDDLKCRIAELDDRIISINSPTLSGMPRGGVPVTKADLIAKKDELERRLKNREDKSKLLKAETLDEIDKLDDIRYVNLLETFLIDCVEFNKLPETLGYSPRHIDTLYKEAVLELIDND